MFEQQVSLASGKAIYQRVAKHIGNVTPQRIASCGSRGLRKLGVTRQKSAYCIDLAEKILTKELNLSQIAQDPTEVAQEKLQRVKGIGPWTADIYLLMALGRPDIWPRGDLALEVSIRKFLGLKSNFQPVSSAIALRWAPWRSVAARILWKRYLVEQTRKKNGVTPIKRSSKKL
jgi:DNA-3-methyladenine glycosylase II